MRVPHLMARIRSIHPGIFTDEAWVSCGPLTRLLFLAILTDADDQGVFEWKPLQIKMRLLPGDHCDIAAMLDEMAAVDLVKAFEVGGKKFGAIRLFRRHQRPKKPNAIHPLPTELRDYVEIDGRKDGKSPEPSYDEEEPVPHQFPTGGEIPPQMEDGGWRMEDGVPVVVVASATDWPDVPAKDLVSVLAKLNPRIDPDRHQGFIVGVGEVARWKLSGYSWSLDVVPSIEGTTRGQPVKNWNYFSPIIAQAHASRTRPQDNHEQPDHHGTANGATVAHFPRTPGGRREPDDIVAIARRRAAARERGEIP